MTTMAWVVGEQGDEVRRVRLRCPKVQAVDTGVERRASLSSHVGGDGVFEDDALVGGQSEEVGQVGGGRRVSEQLGGFLPIAPVKLGRPQLHPHHSLVKQDRALKWYSREEAERAAWRHRFFKTMQ